MILYISEGDFRRYHGSLVSILKNSPLRLNMFLSFWYISQKEPKTALWHDLFLSYSGLKWYSLSGFPNSNFPAHICKWNVQSYNFAWLFHIIKVRCVILASLSINELDSGVVMNKSNIASLAKRTVFLNFWDEELLKKELCLTALCRVLQILYIKLMK